MEANKSTVKARRPNTPCQFTLYDDEFKGFHHGNTARLITLARGLLLSLTETADKNMLLAKVTQGSRAVLLITDRDNYEFVLRMPGGRVHLAGGNLATEMKAVSISDLEQMMSDYLSHGKPIRIPSHNTK